MTKRLTHSLANSLNTLSLLACFIACGLIAAVAVHSVSAAPMAEEKSKGEVTTGKPARFVRIEVPGTKKILTLAEVEVISGGKNIAKTGKATQSSNNGGGEAPKAIDGNKSSNWGDGGQTHTANSGTTNPWWELDLGTAVAIESVGIWNRADFESRLDQFTLTLLDADRAVVFKRSAIKAPYVMAIDVKNAGKLSYFDYNGKPGKPAAKTNNSGGRSNEPELAEVP